MNRVVEAPVRNIIAEKPVEVPRRWGFWSTLLFSVIIAFLFTVAQGFAIGVVVGIQSALDPAVSKEELLESVSSNGFYLSIGIIFSAWVGSLIIAAVVLLRKNISLKGYLAIKQVSLKTYALWMVIGLLFLACWQGISVVMEQPGSEWMLETYETAEYLPLLWVAIIIAAPLIEELFFRGFLFEGLRDSRIGAIGAVLVTSIVWAAIHVQYEMFQMVMIGTLGVLLGIAKIKTRSLYIPLAMHSLNNLIAMVVTSMYIDY